MLARLYANNFRCLVAFEARFDSFCVLCGPNGGGKSSVFDAINLLRKLATGESLLGGEGERDIRDLDLTSWLDSKVQELEIDIQAEGHSLGYLIHLEQVSSDLKPRVIRERATCDGRLLYERDLNGVFLQKASGVQTSSSTSDLKRRRCNCGSTDPAEPATAPCSFISCRTEKRR